jgi:hypothetical protein
MAVQQENYGHALLKWQAERTGGFAGAVILGSKQVALLHDEDEDRLLSRLRNEAGRLHPDYVVFDGAVQRYLRFFPGGLQSASSGSSERAYKERAAQRLRASLPLDQ